MPGNPRALLRVYAAAIFLSAALLFAVQPMFTKMVVPKLGGTPSVWSVAMVFFQGVLLLGYAYAHALTSYLPGKRSLIVHLVVMAAAVFFLPLAISPWFGKPPADATAAFWLLGLFAVSIGLPFFALSANGPLLQAWFARTDHPSAANPYFLYAASNVGSFLALLAYPFAIEPFSRLGQQTWTWAAFFIALIALIAWCGVLMLRSPGHAQTAAAEETEPPPTTRDALIWIFLAAVPSALLIAVTAHISTDIAAAPFMWVVPLALYLLTFVIVFARRTILPHDWVVTIEPVFIVALVGIMVFDIRKYPLWLLAFHVLVVFVITLVCHGELSRRRPAAKYLTGFYMWMSTGGVIGGIFAGLIAPNIFTWIAEYPALLVLAILCRPGLVWPSDWKTRVAWLAAIAIVAIAAWPGLSERYVTDKVLTTFTLQGYTITLTVFNVAIGSMLVIAGLVSREPLPFAAVIAVVFIIGHVYNPDAEQRVTMRSFFGVHKITESTDGQYRVFLHGTTIHGAERLRDAAGNPIQGKPPLITYYHPNSPMGVTVKATRARVGGPIKVAVVGLGTGTFACQAEPGDSFTFYEIDATVLKMARDPAYFTYLTKCYPNVPVVLGDARLTLAETKDKYDLIVVDGFTSDAIPIHLMTKEAMAVYLNALAPGGIVLLHISNRYMELASVVAGIADANGLVSRLNNRASHPDETDAHYIFSSTVVISARRQEDFGILLQDTDWTVIEPTPGQRVWTDDYSNVIGAVLRQYRRFGGSSDDEEEEAVPEPPTKPELPSDHPPVAEPPRNTDPPGQPQPPKQ